jgi:glutaminase
MGSAEDSETALLRLLPREYRTLLLSRMTTRRYAPGEVVIRRGEPGDELFLVRSGRFTTSIDALSQEGRIQPNRLATFVPGMVFGEISFISGNFRTADVVAVDGGSCWVMDRRDFDVLKEQNPDVVIELLQALSFDLGRKLAHTNLQLTRCEVH